MVNPTTPPVPTSIAGLANIPTTPSGSDFVPVSRGGITYKATAAQFGTVGPAGPTGPSGANGTVVPWAVAGGGADAITATYSPPNGSLSDGLLLSFRASAANATTTPTFAPDGLTAHVITDDGGSAVPANAIPAALAECLVRYNLAHTRWELLNPAGGGVSITGSPSSGNLAKFSGSSSITNGDLSGDVSTSGTLATTLATVNSNTGSFASVTVNGKGLVTAAANLTGDITTSGSVSTLATVNANVGSFTYANITVDGKGRITAAANGSGSVNAYQAQPGNPTGTSSATATMQGLAGAITPSSTGAILIIISGAQQSSGSAAALTIQGKYGTGTAPANAASLTGTSWGPQYAYNVAAEGSSPIPFSVSAIVTGLSLATAYWVDLALATSSGNTVKLTTLSLSICEIK